MKPQLHTFLMAAMVALSSNQAFAHSTVKSTVPASGSVLNRSPDDVFINFNEPARLTSLVLVEAGVADRNLEFTPPSGSTTTIRIPSPKLGAGRNEIKWKALSKDGHPIAGSIIIIIRPGAPVSNGATGGDHEPH